METPPPFEPDIFFEAVSASPDIGVTVLTRFGRVTYANPAARVLFYGDDRFDPVGKTIEEIEGVEFARKRMALIAEVCRSRRPHAIRHVRLGQRIESDLYPYAHHGDDGPVDRVLCLTRRLSGGAAMEANLPTFDSRIATWGELSPLTPRELQTLALIAQGQTQKQVAAALGVSVKTVETHRTSIGRKLHAQSVPDLCRFAARAGLQLDDASLRRQRGAAWA